MSPATRIRATMIFVGRGDEACNMASKSHSCSCYQQKTLYEMQHKKKPHLAGIQEFRVAAYVKDLKAGKLDARAKVGQFVGYDLESKGYRIYWPQK